MDNWFTGLVASIVLATLLCVGLIVFMQRIVAALPF